MIYIYISQIYLGCIPYFWTTQRFLILPLFFVKPAITTAGPNHDDSASHATGLQQRGVACLLGFRKEHLATERRRWVHPGGPGRNR